ncbi:MAG: RIP metalloprotease RseP [Verrucomicrobiales bacterium]|nr:RIP metalloprotease RseP [Verrucomicrobiales bacterium]
MELILSILRFIWTIFLVIMVFNFMILVHEYGHYIAARWRGLVVDRFQIWFGKPIWKKEIDGVQYGLGCIPAGGFVSLPQMVTMEGIEGKVDDDVKDALPPITPLDKIIVAAAGPLFSFLLAIAFAIIAWGVKYPRAEAEMTTTVGYVAEGSAADEAGIKPGDKIKSIAGGQVDKFLGMGNSVKWQVVSAPIGPVDVVIDRDGKEMTLKAEIKKPEVEASNGAGDKIMKGIFKRPELPSIGVGSRITPIVAEVMPNSPGAAAGLEKGDKVLSLNGEKVWVDELRSRRWTPGEKATLKIERKHEEMELTIAPRLPDVVEITNEELLADYNKNPPVLGVRWDRRGESWLDSDNPVKIVTDGAKSIYNTLQKVFSPKSAISGAHLSGPAGIGGILFDFLRQENGWRQVLFFGALLNVNLAILNLLPFPVLDGGHIVMATTEWIRRKPTPVKLLLIVQNLFVYLLFGFMIFITFKDIGDRLPGKKKPKEVYKVEWTPIGGKPVQ